MRVKIKRMTQANHIIELFGGTRSMARILGHRNPTTVQGWKERGTIPTRHHSEILVKGKQNGIEIRPKDFFPELIEAAE